MDRKFLRIVIPTVQLRLFIINGFSTSLPFKGQWRPGDHIVLGRRYFWADKPRMFPGPTICRQLATICSIECINSQLAGRFRAAWS